MKLRNSILERRDIGTKNLKRIRTFLIFMYVDFRDVRQLEDVKICAGGRWIYSADFNSCKRENDGIKLGTTTRVDEELADLQQIVAAGGKIVILAHKGRYKDKTAEELDFVAPYLSDRLGIEVKYCNETVGSKAIQYAQRLENGEVVVLGNTRKNPNEEKNAGDLASHFSVLGDKAAIGGFGKAHRAHASNVGILDYMPGFLTRSQIAQMRLLAPWAGEDEAHSIAVLGGVKKEKIIIGLELAESYDRIIPGGIVLNTALKVMGYEIGKSVIEDSGRSFETEMSEFIERYPNKLSLPTMLLAARKNEYGEINSALIDIESEDVPDDYMIVDFLISDFSHLDLERVCREHGRLLIAGTPGLVPEGFTAATTDIAEYVRREDVRGLILGGDSADDIGECGSATVSTGGGSALSFLGEGTTKVFEALKRNRIKFKE